MHLSWCISLPPTSYCDNPPPPAPHTARSPLTCHRCRCRSCGAYHPASSSSAQRGCRGRKTRQDGVMRACSPQCKFSGISVYLQGGLRFPAWDCEDCSLELRVATVTEAQRSVWRGARLEQLTPSNTTVLPSLPRPIRRTDLALWEDRLGQGLPTSAGLEGVSPCDSYIQWPQPAPQ